MANRLGPCPCGGERVPGQGYCRECRARYMRKWRGATGEHRRREAARQAARYLIRIGVLKRQPCEACGEAEDVEMHHDDYNKVADVRWLCPAHHGDEPKDRLLPSGVTLEEIVRTRNVEHA